MAILIEKLDGEIESRQKICIYTYLGVRILFRIIAFDVSRSSPLKALDPSNGNRP